MINKNSLGLTLGLFLALAHAIWGVLLWAGAAQPLADWIMMLHHLDVAHAVTPFNFGTAALLVVTTFVIGYVTGWVLAAIWNWVRK